MLRYCAGCAQPLDAGLRSSTISAEQQRRKLCQVSSPDHPGVHSRRFDVGVRNALRFQPFAEIAVRRYQTVFCATGDPQQLHWLIRFEVETGEVFLEGLRQTTRAECADPCELVEIVQ